MNDDLRAINWDPLYELDNVIDAGNFFKMCVSKVFDKHAPLITKRIRGKPCAWMNDEIKSHMNTRDKLFRKWRKSRTSTNKENYRQMRNLVNIMVRSAKEEHTKQLLRDSSNDSNKF